MFFFFLTYFLFVLTYSHSLSIIFIYSPLLLFALTYSHLLLLDPTSWDSSPAALFPSRLMASDILKALATTGSGSQQPRHPKWEIISATNRERSAIVDHYKRNHFEVVLYISFYFKPIHYPTSGKVLPSRTNARLHNKSLLSGDFLLRIDHRAIHQGLTKIKSYPEGWPENWNVLWCHLSCVWWLRGIPT